MAVAMMGVNRLIMGKVIKKVKKPPMAIMVLRFFLSRHRASDGESLLRATSSKYSRPRRQPFTAKNMTGKRGKMKRNGSRD